jgi:cytochrome c oxidase subunit 2
LNASPLGGSSPGARAIADLFTTTLAVCAVIFVVVCVLIAACVVKFRERDDRAPSTITGHTKLEIAWTIGPFLVLVFLLVLTARAMAVSDPPPTRDPDLVIVAHQWWWEVRYKSGAVTANEIHIPTGTPLVVSVESADVVHDFWVPDLARKMDAIPGRPASIWLEADQAGSYLGTCAEFCGAEHAWMRILVVAEPPAAFAAWEKHQLEPAPTPKGGAAERGLAVFRDRTCVRCHGIAGSDAGAHVAPDLTHLASRTTLGSGVMPNGEAELARWIRHPSAFKPESHMPDVDLTDAELSDLVAYFESLR